MNNITPAEQKRLNRIHIYSYIYQEKQTSKQAIASVLQLSLPTVSQNIKDLEECHLIEKNGFFSSECGRKARIIQCNAKARLAIGVEIFTNEVNIVAIDLYGNIVNSTKKAFTYKNEEAYFVNLGKSIDTFVALLDYGKDNILGVGIAIQSLISLDGNSVIYGKIMNNLGITLNKFKDHISYPCSLIHDAKAAASAEQWFQHINDAIYVGLNENIGGAVIVDGKIHTGKHSRSGAIEHMNIVQNGRPCYCGRYGCMESYCSANYLKEVSGVSIETFFEKLKCKDTTTLSIWDTYLKKLALSLDNVRFVIDSTIILGGKIASYLTEEDYETINQNIPKAELCDIDIIPGCCKDYASAIGAALQYVSDFLRHL